jgi:hypothetical protein
MIAGDPRPPLNSRLARLNDSTIKQVMNVAV